MQALINNALGLIALGNKKLHGGNKIFSLMLPEGKPEIYQYHKLFFSLCRTRSTHG